MDFDDEIIKFNMFEMMRYPMDIKMWYTLSTTRNISQKYFEMLKAGQQEMGISNGVCFKKEKKILKRFDFNYVY